MSKTPAKNIYSFRLPEKLVEWVDEVYATEPWGFDTRTGMIQGLLEAARDGRLSLRPPGPDAFPRETIEPGKTPYHPILIGIAPNFDEPDEVFLEAFPAEAGRE